TYCQHQSNDAADAIEDQPLADEQPFECSGLSTQGEADADLVAALRDSVGKNSVDSDNRQCQRHSSGYPQQNECEGCMRHRLSIDIVQSTDFGQRQIGINGVDLSGNFSKKRSRAGTFASNGKRDGTTNDS